MTFILVPNKGEDVQVNAWNWRPTLLFLLAENIIGEQDHELLGTNGIGSRVDRNLVLRIASALDKKLSTMRPGERLRADLTVTDIPKTPQVFTPDGGGIDELNLYSATYEWLVTFRDFCKRCEGFLVS